MAKGDPTKRLRSVPTPANMPGAHGVDRHEKHLNRTNECEILRDIKIKQKRTSCDLSYKEGERNENCNYRSWHYR